MQWAFTLSHRNEFERSDEILNQILLAAQTHGLENSPFAVKALILKGSNQKDRQKLKEARKLYTEALKRAKSSTSQTSFGIPQELFMGWVIFRLGLLDKIEGKTISAEELLQKSIELLESCSPIPAELPQVYRHLIEVKERLDKYDDGARILKKALKTSGDLKNIEERKDLLQISSRISRKLGKEDEAKKDEEKFRDVLNELISIHQFDPSLSSLEKTVMKVHSLIENKEYAAASEVIQEILESENLSANSLIFFTQTQSKLFLELRRFEEAIDSMGILIGAARKADELQLEGETLEIKGSIQLKLGKLKDACETFVDLIAIMDILSKSKAQKLREFLKKTMLKEGLSKVEGNRGKAYIQEGNIIWKQK